MPVNSKQQRRGFTLIEMMVSVSIFSIVMLIGTGSILAVVNANRKAQSIKSVVNNLNFALETMSRNIRVGTTYRCDGNLPNASSASVRRNCKNNGDDHLIIEPQYGSSATTNDQVIYFYDASQQALFRQIGTSGSPVRITAEEVKLTYVRFFVDGSKLDDEGIQPRVRILVEGYADVGKERSTFRMQTTVVQRILQI